MVGRPYARYYLYDTKIVNFLQIKSEQICWHSHHKINTRDYTAISVVGIYYLLYLPGIVNAFMEFSWKAYVNHVTLVLLSCNGIASPLIYVWRSETFRHYISVMFGFRAPNGAARRNVSAGSNRPDCPWVF